MNIVILNGTSSSGKSTIAKLFQEQMREPEWLLLSIDDFLSKMPSHAFENKEKFSQNILRLVPGFHRCIASIANQGVPVIVDHVLQETEWAKDLKEVLADLSCLYIGLRCPIDILEEREKKRGDRELGMAKMQFEKVHQGITYGLELDTNIKSPEECIQEIRLKLAEIS